MKKIYICTQEELEDSHNRPLPNINRIVAAFENEGDAITFIKSKLEERTKYCFSKTTDEYLEYYYGGCHDEKDRIRFEELKNDGYDKYFLYINVWFDYEEIELK